MMRLDLKKRVLSRVSLNRENFKRELENSLIKLNRQERQTLKEWVIREYGAKYPKLIEHVFKKESMRIRLGL